MSKAVRDLLEYITFSIGVLGMLSTIKMVFTEDWFSFGTYLTLVVGIVVFSSCIIESGKYILKNRE